MAKPEAPPPQNLGELTVNRTLFACAILASTALTSAAYAADTIKIGLSGPFTGG